MLRTAPYSAADIYDADGNSLQNASFIGHVESCTCFTPEGDLIESYNNKIRYGSVPTGPRVCAQRHPNLLSGPSPVPGPISSTSISRSSIRTTPMPPWVLAAQDGASGHLQMDPPQTWVDGTVEDRDPHRNQSGPPGSSNAKPDGPNSTGTLKFEMSVMTPAGLPPLTCTLSPSSSRRQPDHQPFAQGSDFESYAKFLVAIGATGVFVDINGSIIDNGAHAQRVDPIYFHQLWGSGKDGPTWTEVNASYFGTNLGSISMTTQGIQEWMVPDSGTYVVEAAGAWETQP